jgi:hypothetical protein
MTVSFGSHGSTPRGGKEKKLCTLEISKSTVFPVKLDNLTLSLFLCKLLLSGKHLQDP